MRNSNIDLRLKYAGDGKQIRTLEYYSGSRSHQYSHESGEWRVFEETEDDMDHMYNVSESAIRLMIYEEPNE